jgi:GAF domain-containing protein
VTDDPDLPAPADRPDRLIPTLHAVALRVEAARRLAPPAGTAVLRSIVEATVALFGAEAASLALHDPTTDRLVFQVAAGERGQGVVGLAIESGQGVAGYVFSTGQPIALSDVARDSRFGRATAEQTGYVPRSLIAVPLVDDEGVLGVLEVLDKRGDGGFDLHDVELATVFARQATVAIRSSRVERDTASLLRSVLLAADAAASATDPAFGDDGASGDPIDAELEAIIAAEVRTLDADDDDPLWALADQIALLRAADPGQLELVRDLLEVLVRRSDRGRAGRPR